MGQIYHTDTHDTVMLKYAELVKKNNPERYRVLTKGEIKPKGSDPVPDILLKDSAGRKALVAIQIETVETLGREGVEEHWRVLADKYPKVQVVVPKGTLARAKRLGKKTGARLGFQEY